MTDAELQRVMPEIRWRDPLPLAEDGYGCKLCAAREPDNVPKFTTLAAFHAHLNSQHKTVTE